MVHMGGGQRNKKDKQPHTDACRHTNTHGNTRKTTSPFTNPNQISPQEKKRLASTPVDIINKIILSILSQAVFQS